MQEGDSVVDQFQKKFERLSKINQEGISGFDEQFNYVEQKSSDDSFFGDYTSAHKPENRPKNRYANVLPLENSRVVLSGSEAFPHANYINANYISGSNTGDRAYIATQGPLEDTTADFWRMIWEEKVRVIVMLTNLFENGRNKCFHYYPHSRRRPGVERNLLTQTTDQDYDREEERMEIKTEEPVNPPQMLHSDQLDSSAEEAEDFFGKHHEDHTQGPEVIFEGHGYKYKVELVQKKKRNHLIERVLELSQLTTPYSSKKSKEVRTVYHFQYTEWPDHGLPESTATFRELLSLVENQNKFTQSAFVKSENSKEDNENQEEEEEDDEDEDDESDEEDEQFKPPIVVHCSAGIGRTGTFCAVHSILTKIGLISSSSSSPSPPSQEESSMPSSFADLDIMRRVLQLRKERIGMVQTREQYEFCYRAILEALQDQVPK